MRNSANCRSFSFRCVAAAMTLCIPFFPLGDEGKADDGANRPQPVQVDFATDVQPILSAKCLACHGPDTESREAGLNLLARDSATGELESGAIAITPGDAGASEVIARVTATDEDERMPPDADEALTAEEIATLRAWIDSGAKYAVHWSYAPLRRPPPPDAIDSDWSRSEIDRFVLARMQTEKLFPAPPADRPRLLRRLSLDLIGLPPTIEEVDAFIADEDEDAYERQVDRLLASPRYGEHWARKWLDLARYADSQGYAQDEPRTIWPYRDWVIDAFNRDLPYDQFTVEQLAGDLLPEPTREQLIATAFHRNTMTNTEGGTDDEEFRHAAVVDRVNTTFQVWMGLTMGCAQCHTHKYDPISHDEYYQAFAIFNQTEDNDQPDNRPTIPTPTEAQTLRLEALRDRVASLENGVASRQENAPKQGEGTPGPFAIADAKSSGAPPEPTSDKVDATAQLEAAKKELSEFESTITTTPICKELPADNQRPCTVFDRGAFLSPGHAVFPGVPAAFGALPEGVAADRLALARWLVAEGNPLTARVAVNRHWEQLFGAGLVETSEDFGAQGEAPSHPDLLDWLAAEFIDGGWSMKRLTKSIVMSATYRQSSKVTPAKLAKDPRNRLLARGPRFRLSAEQIRDQALAASGLLSSKMHGPPVRPPQPKSGLNAAFGGSLDWETSTGDDRYRRGLYTMWRRVSPYPSMIALDATNRSVCTVRRIRTNTPVGAFVTLNDPVFVETAQALARRMIEAAPDAPLDAVTHGFRRVVARHPTEVEQARLIALYETQRTYFESNHEAAIQLATEPLGPLPDGANAAETAAWVVVANVLLNLDETLTHN